MIGREERAEWVRAIRAARRCEVVTRAAATICRDRVDRQGMADLLRRADRLARVVELAEWSLAEKMER